MRLRHSVVDPLGLDGNVENGLSPASPKLGHLRGVIYGLHPSAYGSKWMTRTLMRLHAHNSLYG